MPIRRLAAAVQEGGAVFNARAVLAPICRARRRSVSTPTGEGSGPQRIRSSSPEIALVLAGIDLLLAMIPIALALREDLREL
jgi:hypothetical protein